MPNRYEPGAYYIVQGLGLCKIVNILPNGAFYVHATGGQIWLVSNPDIPPDLGLWDDRETLFGVDLECLLVEHEAQQGKDGA